MQAPIGLLGPVSFQGRDRSACDGWSLRPVASRGRQNLPLPAACVRGRARCAGAGQPLRPGWLRRCINIFISPLRAFKIELVAQARAVGLFGPLGFAVNAEIFISSLRALKIELGATLDASSTPGLQTIGLFSTAASSSFFPILSGFTNSGVAASAARSSGAASFLFAASWMASSAPRSQRQVSSSLGFHLAGIIIALGIAASHRQIAPRSQHQIGSSLGFHFEERAKLEVSSSPSASHR